MNANSALQQYRNVGNQSAVMDASPHQLVAMLFNGALQRIAEAKGHIDRNEVSLKGEKISKAIAIVDSLRASLDHEVGGEVTQNLHSLYDYIESRLMKANLNSSQEILDEVAGLIREVKSGWDEIPEEMRHKGGK
ncbi:flagellar export chaperone FliS [Porticoccaceae bacterium LTM1]|nr:flagellar export chaperone FliS [Porticoccaceae bacterium LTM1]